MLEKFKNAYRINRTKQIESVLNQRLYGFYGDQLQKTQQEMAKLTDEFEAAIIVCQLEFEMATS